jgi:hypothetical protein
MMTTQPPASTPPGPRRRAKRHGSSRASYRSSVLIVAILFVFGLGLHLSGNLSEFLHALYSPVALIAIIIMMAQYIVLKGRDRSRMYRIELHKARHKRTEEIEFLQTIEARLGEAKHDLDVARQASEPVPTDLEAVSEKIDRIRIDLSSRL